MRAREPKRIESEENKEKEERNPIERRLRAREPRIELRGKSEKEAKNQTKNSTDASENETSSSEETRRVFQLPSATRVLRARLGRKEADERLAKVASILNLTHFC